MMRLIVAAILIGLSSAEAFAGVSSIVNFKTAYKKARNKACATLMKKTHDGYDSPLWLTRVELNKDVPNWEVLSKQARAFALMAEVMSPAHSEITYTARSRYWFATNYVNATNSLGKAIQNKDLKAANASMGNVLQSCANCHYRSWKFTRDLDQDVLLENKTGDIAVVTEIGERTMVRFFQRNQVSFAMVSPKDLKVLAEGKRIEKLTFVAGTSTNDDPPEAHFGSFVRIAAPPGPVAKLIAKHLNEKPDSPLTLIFFRGPSDENIFHPVGVTARDPWSFFDPKVKHPPGDDISTIDLIRKKPK